MKIDYTSDEVPDKLLPSGQEIDMNMKSGFTGGNATLLKVLLLILFSVLGYGGNYFSLPVSYNVDFIFGSIFILVSVRLLGCVGIFTALIASSYTYSLWHHPYAMIIFTAEAVFVAICLKKGRSNILVMDVLYWLCVGIPLVFIFYAGIMQLGVQTTLVIALNRWQ